MKKKKKQFFWKDRPLQQGDLISLFQSSQCDNLLVLSCENSLYVGTLMSFRDNKKYRMPLESYWLVSEAG